MDIIGNLFPFEGYDMPFKRSYRRKRFFGKKKGASKLKRVSKKVNRLSHMIPVKQVSTRTATNIGTAGAFILLNGLIKGTDLYNRVGSATRARDVVLRMAFAPDSTAANLRVILAWYKQPLGSAPAAAALLQGRDNAGSATSLFNSPYSYIGKGEFTILRDTMISMGGYINATTGFGKLGVRSMKWVVPLKNHQTVYSVAGNAGTIADINSGALYLFIMSDNNTNLPTYDIASEFNFHDA